MSDGGVCRKAPATPGVLNNSNKFSSMKVHQTKLGNKILSKTSDRITNPIKIGMILKLASAQLV